jgi:hypothetical protein
LAVAAVMEKQARFAVGDQSVELGRRHPPVERHQHRAQFGAAQQDFEEGDAVAAQDRDPVAGGDAPRRHQSGGCGGASVEFGIIAHAARRDLLDRHRARRQRRALGDEIGHVGDHGARVLNPSDTRSIASSATCCGGTSLSQIA